MQRKLLAVVLALSVGALAACSGNHDPVPPTPSVPTIQPNTTTPNPQLPATTTPPPVVQTTQPPIAQPDPVCKGGGWTTDLRENDTMSSDDLYQVRPGKHDTCDRVVFDIDGPANVGYHVGYVPQLTMDGSGKSVYVQGKAVLQVVIRAHTQGEDVLKPVFQTEQWLLRDGKHKGYKALRSIRFANSYEGNSTIGIGVAAKDLEFRVQVLPGENGGDTRVVVDIKHP